MSCPSIIPGLQTKFTVSATGALATYTSSADEDASQAASGSRVNSSLEQPMTTRWVVVTNDGDVLSNVHASSACFVFDGYTLMAATPEGLVLRTFAASALYEWDLGTSGTSFSENE